MSLEIVFYDKMDNDGRGARAVHALARPESNVLYIGLDRDLNLSDKECIRRSSGILQLSEDVEFPEKMHYLDFLKNSGYTQGELGGIAFLDLAPRKEKEALALSEYCAYHDINTKVIDHHPLPYEPGDFGFDYLFSVEKCACMIAWEHFNPDTKPPLAVILINDRDVWNNIFQPLTSQFHNVSEMMKESELMDAISGETELTAWLAVGAIREKSNQREIQELLDNMQFGTLFGKKIVYTENELNWDLLSELGNRACSEYPDVDAYCHVYFKESTGKFSYSMRSLNGEAKAIITDNSLEGGGHANAAGFKNDKYLIERFSGLNLEKEVCNKEVRQKNNTHKIRRR